MVYPPPPKKKKHVGMTILYIIFLNSVLFLKLLWKKILELFSAEADCLQRFMTHISLISVLQVTSNLTEKP